MLRSIIERAVQKVMFTASLRDGIASFVRDKELSSFENWLRGPDLNRRPSGYEPDELPSCSIPRPCMSLLSTMRAVKLVAGAGFEPPTFGL